MIHNVDIQRLVVGGSIARPEKSNNDEERVRVKKIREYSGNRVQVMRALRVMRKAHYVKHDKKSEVSTGKIDAVTIIIPPLLIKNVPQIEKEAVKIYQDKRKMTAKLDGGKNKNAGVKRRIFVSLIDEVVEEMNAIECRKEQKREKIRREIEDENLLIRDKLMAFNSIRSDESFMKGSLVKNEPRSITRTRAGRPATAPSNRSTALTPLTPTKSHDNFDESSFGIRKSNIRLINENGADRLSPLLLHTRRSPSPENRLSVINAKLNHVKEVRETLIQQEQEHILEKIRERESLKQQRAEQLKLLQLQSSWLVNIAQCSRFSVLYYKLVAHRAEVLKWKTASIEKKAVRLIETWWPFALITLKLKRETTTRNLISLCTRSVWWKIQRRKRYEAQAIIFKFISDVTGLGETVAKVYAFRSKIKICQRYVRDFLNIKLHRLQLLWKSLETKETRLRVVLESANLKKLAKSRRAVGTMRGMGTTARLIEGVSKDLENLLTAQDSKKDKWARNKRLEDDDQKRGKGSALDRMNAWRNEMISTATNGAQKIAYLENVLRQQRKRHVISIDNMTKRDVSEGGPRATLADARALLDMKSKDDISKLQVVQSVQNQKGPTGKL